MFKRQPLLKPKKDELIQVKCGLYCPRCNEELDVEVNRPIEKAKVFCDNADYTNYESPCTYKIKIIEIKNSGVKMKLCDIRDGVERTDG